MSRTACRLTALMAALLLVFGVSAGCGTHEKVAQLKGTVTFKGQPVPAGWISFMPDSTRGNQGSVVVAQIKDGVYDTILSGAGVVPGPNVIRIAGFDGKVIPRWAQGKQIFNIHELRETLPEGATAKDFTVPDSAGENVKIEPTADQ